MDLQTLGKTAPSPLDSLPPKLPAPWQGAGSGGRELGGLGGLVTETVVTKSAPVPGHIPLVALQPKSPREPSPQYPQPLAPLQAPSPLLGARGLGDTGVSVSGPSHAVSA